MSKKPASRLFDSEEPKSMKEDAMNLPEETETKENSDPVEEKTEDSAIDQTPKEFPMPTTGMPTDGIIDVDLTAIKKSRFRFNGDNSKILELNTRDLGISYRLKETYTKLNSLMEEVANTLKDDVEPDEITDEYIENVSAALKKLDDSMRKELDYLFDAPVSDVLGSDGSMYDPIGGAFRYEHIIDRLTQLYESDLNTEFARMKQRVANRTAKYTGAQKAKNYHR